MEQDLARVTADLEAAKKHKEELEAANQKTTDELTAKIQAKDEELQKPIMCVPPVVDHLVVWQVSSDQLKKQKISLRRLARIEFYFGCLNEP